MLHSGLTDEDLLLAHLSAIPAVDSVSPIFALKGVVVRITAVDGVFSPLRSIPLAIWLLAGSVEAAKALQLSLILCNVVTYCLFARKLFRSNGGALLATALTLCVWQMRYPHDPTLGSSFLWPWSSEFILIALYAIMRFSRHGGARWSIVASLASITAGLSNFALLPVVVLLPLFSIAVSPPPRRIPITIGLAASALIVVFAELTYGESALATWGGIAYLRTVAVQLLAALPTTYRALGNVSHDFPLDSFADTRFQDIPDVTTVGWLAILGTTTAAFAGYKLASTNLRYRSASAAVMAGIMLWVGPALAFRPTPYWHSGLPTGQGFGSVYVEQFGVGLILAWFMLAVGRWRIARRNSIDVGLSVVVFLIMFGNVRANAFAIQRLGQADYTRAMIDRSGADGFFAALPSGSTIVIPRNSNLYSPVYGRLDDAKYAMYHYTGRLYSMATQSAIRPGGGFCREAPDSSCSPAQANIYILSTANAHLTDPQLSLARWSGSHDGIDFSDIGHGFAAFPTSDAASAVASLLVSAQPGVRYNVSPKIESSALAFTATRTCGPVPLSLLYAPATPSIAWGQGFYPATTFGELPIDAIGDPPYRGTEPLFRWAGPRAELTVTRSTCPPTNMKVSFAVVTSQPAMIHARWARSEATLRGGAHTLTAFNIELSQDLRSPIQIVLTTDASAFVEERLRVRNEGEAPQDRRMLVVQPSVEDTLTSPLDSRLNPTGGLL
jgi:hypothetical protein